MFGIAMAALAGLVSGWLAKALHLKANQLKGAPGVADPAGAAAAVNAVTEQAVLNSADEALRKVNKN